MKLRFICAQPTSLYYAWQVEVMINNFIEMGINPNMIDIVCWKINDVIPEEWTKLAANYPARFFFILIPEKPRITYLQYVLIS